jgi:hypothetical protein
MAADAIEIYLDISQPKAPMVKGLSDRATFALGPALQYSALTFKVFLVKPTGATISPPYFSQVDNAGMGLKCYVGPRPGVEAILAEQTVFALVPGPDVDGRVNYFSGILNLNDTRLNAALPADTLSTFLEFHLNRGDGLGFVPVAQTPITIESSVHDPGAAITPATPTEINLFRAEMTAWALSMFVAWRNDLIAANAGRNLVLSSPSALRGRELGVSDDGSPIDNPS